MTFTPGVDMFVYCGRGGCSRYPELRCQQQAGHKGPHWAKYVDRSEGSVFSVVFQDVTWTALGPEHYTTEAAVTRALLGFTGLITE